MTLYEPTIDSEPTLGGEIRNVCRHSAIYMLVPAISKIVGFLLFPLYTTYLTTSDYGINSLIEVAMTFALLVMAMNFSAAMTRFYYATEDESERNQIVSTVFFGMFCIGLPAIFLLVSWSVGIANLLKLDHQFIYLLRWAFCAAWLGAISELGFSFLRMRYMAKTFLAANLSQLLLVIGLNILFVVFMQWGIAGIVFANLIAQAVVGMVLSSLIIGTTKAKPSWTKLKSLVRFGLPLVPSALSQQLNNYIHPIMLQWLSAADPIAATVNVGIYAVGQKIAVVVNRFVVVPFNSFWMPRRMELVMQDQPNSNRIVARICTYSTMATAAFALLLSATSESFLQLLSDFGFVKDGSYLQAHYVIPLIALAYTVHSLEHHFTTGMLASGKTKPATLVGLISFAVIFVANLFLIPAYGYLGAAFATVAGVTIRSILFLAVSQTRYPIQFETKRLAMILTTAIGFFLVSQRVGLESTIVTLLCRVTIAMSFVPLHYLCGFFDVNEVAKIRTASWEFLSKVFRPLLQKGSRTSV